MTADFYDKLIAGLEVMRRNHPTGDFSIEDERIYVEPTALNAHDHSTMIENGWIWCAEPGTYFLNTSNYHDE